MSNIRRSELNDVIGRVRNCLDSHAFHEGQLSILMRNKSDDDIYNEAIHRYKYWDDKSYMISEMFEIPKSEDYENRKLGENRHRLYEVLDLLEAGKTALDSVSSQIQLIQFLNIKSGDDRDAIFKRLRDVEKSADSLTEIINRLFDNETQYNK
jgi:hypothetical protein